MAVGQQASNATVDGMLTGISVGMRNLMQQSVNLSVFVNGQGDGQAFLESIGYSVQDATLALSMISYLNTVAGLYFGTGTQPDAFDFNQELSQLWFGQ